MSSAVKDKLALDVYRHAESTGSAVTVEFVASRLAELGSHDDGCGCGLCGPARAQPNPIGVYYVARAWTTAASRRRA